jgi:hypothetical protein
MSVISDALALVEKQQNDTAERIKSNLHMLQELAQAKLDEMQVETDKQIAEAAARHEIPAGLKVFEASQVVVMASSGPADGIDRALNGLLKDAEKNWKDAVRDLVTIGVNTVLGNASGGVQESHYYIIALDGHAAGANGSEETYVPVRLDYRLWAYDLQSKGIVDQATHAIAYHARKSIVDYEKVPSPLQMELSLKDIGMPKALREEIIKMVESYRKGEKNAAAYARNASSEVERENLAILLDV